MRYLRTNTAIRLTVGPFFSPTDGVTPKTALTVTSCHLTFMVDDGNVPTLVLDTNPTASGGNNDMVHVTGDDAGFYDLELTAANVNYLGRAMIALTDATNHCPVFHEFMILPAMIYDSLVLGTDRLDTNVTHIGDTAQTARDLGASVLISSGSGAGQLDVTSGVVKANLAQILGTALTETAGQLAAAFKKFFNIASPASTMDALTLVATATTVTNDVGITQAAADKAWSTTTRALTDKVGFALSAAGVSAIWDALTSALTTVGSIGKRIADNLDAAISSRSTYAGTDTSGTTTLLSRLTSGRATGLDNLDATISSRAATGAAMTLTAGERTAIANEVETQIIDETDSEKVLTAITDKIAAVNPSLGGLTLAAIAAAVRDVANTAPAASSLGAAIKAVADRTPGSGTLATAADVPSAATIAAAAAAQVTTDHGAGSYIRNTEPLDAAATRTAVGLASANLDTQLDALPTALENAAQVTADHGAGSYIRNTEPLDAAATRVALGLASGNLDTQLATLPTSLEIVTDLFARSFGSDFQNKTFAELMQVIVALVAGPTQGAGTTAEVFQSPSNGSTVATVTNDGTDRTATVLA